MSFVGIWSGLRGNLVGPSWEFGRAFVGIWSGLRGNLVGPSWEFGRALVGIWSGLRGNLVGPSWKFGRAFVEIWSGSSGAIQRPPKVFMDFQVCSGIWFEGGVGIIRMSFGSMAGVARRDVLKAEIGYS